MEHKSVKADIRLLKIELEGKIEIIDRTLEQIYANGYSDKYKEEHKLCPECDSIMIKFKMNNHYKPTYSFHCGCGLELDSGESIPFSERYSCWENDHKTFMSWWNEANDIKHPLEILKLRWIEELNLINIGMEDMNNGEPI